MLFNQDRKREGTAVDIYDMPGHLIRRLHQNSVKVFVREAKAAGLDLTPVQFAAMEAVAARPGIDQATVSELIGYDRATIGGVIDRLEQKGYVMRTVSQKDRRAREVVLTDAGNHLLAGARSIVAELQADILANLDETERAEFTALARKALGPLDAA